jgi:hypothetical protein
MNDVMPTQAFLIEMLEAREEAGASPAALARTVERARTQFDETLAAVARGFAGEGSLDELGRRVSELRYLARLVEELGGPRAPASVARH